MTGICGSLEDKAALKKIAESDICLNILPQEIGNYGFAFPIKIFEYMILEKPIISTRTVGTEQILTDRHSAILVSNNEPESVVTAVQRLSEDEELRRELKENAVKDVRLYEWDQIRARIHERIVQL